jgi:hypothetical protein
MGTLGQPPGADLTLCIARFMPKLDNTIDIEVQTFDDRSPSSYDLHQHTLECSCVALDQRIISQIVRQPMSGG